MKITTTCPNCGRRIPQRLGFDKSKKDLRRCDACGLLLARINTDRQPVTTLIAIAVFAPLVVMPMVALALLDHLGMLSLLIWPAGIALAYLIQCLQFPFTNAYVAWHPTCRACGYDMRGSTGPCPECGGQASVHPEAPRQAKSGILR